MKKKINSPLYSKINWTSFLQQVCGILILWNIVPEPYADKVAGSALLIGGLFNQIFRTFYTTNVEPDYNEYDEYNNQ